jgi:four helix bundle protein
MSDDLKRRTRIFALDVICWCADFPNVLETRNAIGQVIRSASSVAANYRAACRGKSTADFIAKLGTVEEEADESEFWLGMLRDIAKRHGLPLTAPTLSELQRLEQEAGELLAITVSSRKTARRNAANATRRPMNQGGEK